MNKTIYICVGTCKAEISEEKYKNGLTKCGADGCNMKGHNFEKRIKCGQCSMVFKEEEKHSHE